MVVEQKTKTNVNIDLLNFTHDHLYSHSSLFPTVFDINFVDCILLEHAQRPLHLRFDLNAFKQRFGQTFAILVQWLKTTTQKNCANYDKIVI